MDHRHLVVLGPMAVGKTTVATALARHLGRPLHDSDAELVAERGINGRELAARDGVPALHRWEAERLLRSLASAVPDVVAAAASVVDDPACRAALGPALVVLLTAPPEVLAARMAAEAGDWRRSLGPDPVAGVAELDRRREPEFAAVADVVVDTAGRTPAEVVAAAEAAIDAAAQGIRGE
jgi:shikimate kinase